MGEKFTPVDWIVEGSRDGDEGLYIVQEKTGGVIAAVSSTLGFAEADIANAEVMAAAPKLLCELRRSTETMNELAAYLKAHLPGDVRITGLAIQIRANEGALAKAEGRTP